MSILLRLLIWWGLSSMSRRARTATGTPVPPWRSPGPVAPGGAAAEARLRRQQRVAQLVAGAAGSARLAWHAVCLVTFLAATSLLVTAGSTLAALGTRWLGVVMLALAAVGGLLAALEGRMVARGLADRRRRRHDALVRSRRG